MIAGLPTRGKSELHRARVPGESRGGAARRRQSTLARGSHRARATETNRGRTTGAAEKGNPPRSNLRCGRYQVARRGRKSRAARAARQGRFLREPREMIITNRTRLTLPPPHHGAFSSIGRAPVCGTGGHGFEPHKAPHPKRAEIRENHASGSTPKIAQNPP